MSMPTNTPKPNTMGPLIAGAISAGGALLGSLFGRKNALKDRAHAEEYYHPKAQVERLKEAGLSPGMLYDSRAAGQSITPGVQEINTGGSEGVAAYTQTRMQNQQFRLMEEEIRYKAAEADLKNAERDILLREQVDGNTNMFVDTDWMGGNMMAQGMVRERRIREAQLQAASIENELGEINVDVQRDLNEKGYLTADFIQKYLHTIKTNREIEERIGQIWASNKWLRSQTTKQNMFNDVMSRIKSQLEAGQFPDWSSLLFDYMFGGMQTPDIIGGIGDLMDLAPSTRLLKKGVGLNQQIKARSTTFYK